MRQAFLLVVLCPLIGWGQLCDSIRGELRSELRLFAGYSPDSPTPIGSAADRQFVLAGVSYSYLCRAWGSTSLSYTGAIMPVAVVIQPDQVVTVARPQGLVLRRLDEHAVYGFAISPLGARLDFARTRSVNPFVEGLLGLIASTEPIPIPAVNSTGLNFTVDVGGGLRWRIADSRAVTFGYKFFHISNANTTSFNPGLDNVLCGLLVHLVVASDEGRKVHSVQSLDRSRPTEQRLSSARYRGSVKPAEPRAVASEFSLIDCGPARPMWNSPEKHGTAPWRSRLGSENRLKRCW